MKVRKIIKDITDNLKSSATVRTVYGEPIRASNKVVIPVAKVAYGFGGGGETERKGGHERTRGAEEGGGGGMAIRPIGVVEVSERRTKFIPFAFRTKLLGAMALGIFAGLSIAKRRFAH